MTVHNDSSRGREEPQIRLHTLDYLGPAKDSKQRCSSRDLIPFGAVLLVAAFDFTLYLLRGVSFPIGIFGAVLIAFVAPKWCY